MLAEYCIGAQQHDAVGSDTRRQHRICQSGLQGDVPGSAVLTGRCCRMSLRLLPCAAGCGSRAANDAPITFIGAGTRGMVCRSIWNSGWNARCSMAKQSCWHPPPMSPNSDRSRERLAYLAYADPLTGLPNRTLLFDRLHQTMLGARRHGSEFAVLMADLDGFKPVNDCFGHDVGDACCTRSHSASANASARAIRWRGSVATNSPSCCRPDERPGRGAGGMRLITALEDPIVLAERQIVVGASVGIATYPKHAGAIEPLLVAADTAMYQAKRSGQRSSSSRRRRPTPANWSRVDGIDLACHTCHRRG